MAKSNPFRFSTKYQAEETDLIYYGYRYYNASTGRWLNRDLIAEKGGLNLYCFLRNNALSTTDFLGLFRDDWMTACAECQCQNVEVTYTPGGSTLALGPYFSFPSYTYGSRVHVKWKVIGNPHKCRYYQDEKGTSGSLVSISPPGLPPQTIAGVDGHFAPQEYTDDMGYTFGNILDKPPLGTFQMTLHWTVTFRCEDSSGPGGKSRHDTFDPPPVTFSVPWW